MFSKNHQPKPEHILFRETALSMGCAVGGELYGLQYHHMYGASARHNKIWIGQWACLPLRFDLHDINGEHEYHVTKNPKGFIEQFGTQKELYFKMVDKIKAAVDFGFYSPGCVPPEYVLEAISDYHL